VWLEIVMSLFSIFVLSAVEDTWHVSLELP
jgi:hypothetical protein